MKSRVSAIAAVLLVGACSQKIDQAKFSGLYHAGQQLKSAVEMGVTLPRYRELLGTYAGEVSIAKDAAKNKPEKEMAGLYAAALDDYKTAADMWALKIEGGRDELMVAPSVKPILSRYGVKIITSATSPDYQTFFASEAIQGAWHEGAKKIDAANQAYNGGSK